MKLCFFKKYIANVIIICVLLSLFSFAIFADKIVTTSSNPKGAIYVGESKDSVSLMFNVYSGEIYLDNILETLKNKNVKTTFFVGGIFVLRKTDYVKKIKEYNNEIGNHGYFHKDHSNMNYEQNYNEIKNTHNTVKELIGVDMNLFAPPSGAFNKNTILAANNLGYKTIMWSKDTIDWRDQNTDLIFNRATKNIKAGDLVLMHPTKCTAKVLGKIIDFILSKGLKINTVTKVLQG